MKKYNVEAFERIHYLVDKIDQNLSYDTSQDIHDYKELLRLSQENNYSYGEAIAHIYLAQRYQSVQDGKKYKYHAEEAYRIAKQKEYFEVLITYYNEEGLRSSEDGDYATAIEIYLKGVQIAISINDQKNCSVFYNNIAEIFFDTKGYDEAEEFYLRSYVSLEEVNHHKAHLYRKITLANLTRLNCLKNKFDDAKKYFYQFNEIVCEEDIIKLITQELQIRMLLIENNKEKALVYIEDVVIQLMESSIDLTILKSEYIYLLDLCMELQLYQLSNTLLDKMESLYTDENQNITLYMQTKRIQLSRLLNVDEDILYASFYAKTQAYEMANKKTTGTSLKSFIALYQAEKERKRLLDERQDLETQSKHDALTQVYNRRFFSKLSNKCLKNHKNHKIGYIMIDVDHFKEYNDYYGHMQGDDVLKKVASVLDKNIYKNAYVARYGGDEFACLFLNYEEEEILAYVRMVQAEMKELHIEHIKNELSKTITLSFGVYCANVEEIHDEYTLIRNADNALYQSKAKGRNTFSVYKNSLEDDEF